MKFLEGLDPDLKSSVLRQLRDLWTYTSTGMEGNSLTLGDTQFVIDEGLTVSGKPIKDHQEVLGHAKAIELVYSLLGKDVDERDIFALHKAVQTEVVSDIYKPYGAWKLEPNGTYAVNEQGRQIFIEYAMPADVPALMAKWLEWFNQQLTQDLNIDAVLVAYAKAHLGFAHIHPFWDGNGRLARLLANLPLLVAGLPPLVITRESRREYLSLLSQYQMSVGQLTADTGVWPDTADLSPFMAFVKGQYAVTQQLVRDAFAMQKLRQRD
jgi:Fic family protein